jgi:hypothetical protein
MGFMRSDKHSPKQVRAMNTAELNFYLGAAMGELAKVFQGTELSEKAEPFLNDLFVLCGEAGYRAEAWEKLHKKPG